MPQRCVYAAEMCVCHGDVCLPQRCTCAAEMCVCRRDVCMPQRCVYATEMCVCRRNVFLGGNAEWSLSNKSINQTCFRENFACIHRGVSFGNPRHGYPKSAPKDKPSGDFVHGYSWMKIYEAFKKFRFIVVRMGFKWWQLCFGLYYGLVPITP